MSAKRALPVAPACQCGRQARPVACRHIVRRRVYLGAAIAGASVWWPLKVAATAGLLTALVQAV